MKSHPFLTVVGAAAVAALAACSTTPVTTAKPAPVANVAPPAPAAPTAQPAPVAQTHVATVTLPAYLDPKSPIHNERSVYFDFDRYNIQDKYNALVQLQGGFLQQHPSVDVRIEGNTDERGSSEYNLSLGQERADAVKKALELVGVKDGQITTMSWGKSHPVALGHDEAAWAQNRRADIEYPKQ
ncbi:MAG: peptidoglycan-associated lipoprotein Pal [Burkholderiales bacterium]|nr:peptidoglycan-associated lipoprotein Pal [Burkholderiales bacterium]MDE1928771.1 peptidoglycan-associated lipoprotein Pal [Burkholderiales bacterium]MDE2504450.1 peptidoglycan-associated lipoprotein Pal [Burkholderiales bacterium]